MKAQLIIICMIFYLLLPSQYVFTQVITWQQVTSPPYAVYDMICNDKDDIIAATSMGGVYKSTDKGDSWNQKNQGLGNLYLCALEKVPDEYIFLGSGGGVYKSTDMGESWVNAGLSGRYINDITINKNCEMFAATFGSGAYYSSDFGNSWYARNNGLSSLIVMSIASKDSGLFFLGTDPGSLYRSTDTGFNWIPVNSGMPPGTVFNFLINRNGIVFAGHTSGIFKSTNNGDQWIPCNNGLTHTNVWAIVENSKGDIFISVADGGVFKSSDEGESWIQENSGLNSTHVIRLLVDNDGYIYAATEELAFFRSDQSTLVSVRNEVSHSPEYRLYQNYPNPFNPVTTISYQLPVEGLVTLNVYNTLGEEVVTLINEEKQAGRYEVSLDGSNLVSGVYIYRLTAGKYTAVKKLVLLK